MPDAKRYEVLFQPDDVAVRVAEGTPLARAAHEAGLPLELPCGGMGQCGQCQVELLRGAGEPDQTELKHLTPHQIGKHVRLACQQKVCGDLTVLLGDQVRSRGNQIMVGSETRATSLDSGVERLEVALGQAPLTDERDDWSRLQEALGRSLQPSLPALRGLPEALRDGDGRLTLTILDGVCRRIEPGAAGGAPLGFAVDIGTTTVVVYLIDLATGAELATAAMLNPQVAYGDDVIARIHFAGVEERGLAMLNREVRRAIDELLRTACAEAGVPPERVARGTVVGNATMTHLFCGINPRGLGLAPFAPIVHNSVTTTAADFGLRAAPEAEVTVLPNIAGFLGSDTVGVLLAAMPSPSATCLAVDIGTNGEIVLHHDGRWYGCSAAAGPAFEGARIGIGMRGAAGAISRIDLNGGGDIDLVVIGNQAPRGLCGSGLLDGLAALLNSGALDYTGRLAANGQVAGALANRLSGDGPERRFLLADAEQSATGEPLHLTAGDIREVQLAKGSIRASIEALLARGGVTTDEVEAVYLAGGFGSFLRVESAIRIGLLPPFDPARVKPVGNAAGAGARLALMSRAEMARAEELALAVEVLYLATDPVYQMQFMEQMVFPEHVGQ